ncbi:LOW QUALITY PROTEIN: T-cell receptor gamma alternate reading frame protein [Sylvia atricapilla]|uniref:LOW QUALITY PROTEIN: T-cell receptor gamma alternate reading frame protein n=1 Tax=Sylvia atricapilla TaxID=48155 RepID=UPI0033946F81
MLLLVVLVATASWFYGFAQEIPTQSPISITKFQKSARMTCEIQKSEANFNSIVVHWYKQKESVAPERLLFVSGDKVTTESGFQAKRYIVERSSLLKRFVLTIKDVIPDDAATYYCAYWDHYNKVFGSGTKLVVSGNSPPANSEILQKKHENQIMYVCLIEKFYPEVIRVTWTDGEKEVTDKVVKGDTWRHKEDEYSIASWLTVPAEKKDKKYYCKYEHEEENALLPTRVDSVKTAPQEENCKTVFNRDQLMQRTAYLVYIILLLKSSMYYLIVLFFIYRIHRGLHCNIKAENIILDLATSEVKLANFSYSANLKDMLYT